MFFETVKEAAEKELVPVIEGLGYEVVETECKRVGKDNHLTFYIYKKEGVTLNDCELVNNALDEPLERLDITKGISYILNISSPGLDRPIVSDADFRRNAETEVEAVFFNNFDKKKKMNGTLLSHDNETVTLDVNGKKVVLRRDNIKVLRPYINLKQLGGKQKK